MNKTQVVVLGRNYTSLLGMIRAVGCADCDVTVVKSVSQIPKKINIKNFLKRIILGKSIEFSSRYVKKYLYSLEPNREELIELLLQEFSDSKEKVILLPTDDFTASTIDLFQDKLIEKFIFPNIANKKGEIVRIMNKNLQKQIAIKSGLNVAKAYIINFENGEYEIPEQIEYPVFTKPQISFKGDKTLMKKCDNNEELKSLLDVALQKYQCPILVEQFVNIEKEYGVLGCSYNNEVVLPGIIEKIESGRGEHKGVTLLGQVTSFNGKEYLCECLKKFISSLNFNGLFDIDLYESNGIIYFNELNLRFGAGGYGVTESGVNLPEIYINKILNSTGVIINKINNKKFISEKVNLEDYEAGYINWKEYKKRYEGIDFSFIKSYDDPKPYRIFKRKEFLVHIKRIIKKFLGGKK